MKSWHTIRRWLLAWLFPNRCLFCDHVIDWDALYCETCEKSIPYAEDVCPLCGKSVCVCSKDFAYDSCAVVCHYRDTAADAVRRMKFQDRPDLAENAGAMMAATVRMLRADTVIPVPMDRRSLRRRGYNQAELLAREITRRAGLTLLPRALRKVRGTQQQHTLSSEERAKNLAGAFAVFPSVSLRGKAVLLCDDVLTTGHTLHACAAALKKAGVIRVDCVVFASVPEKMQETT